MVRKIRGHEYANCKVIVDDNEIRLISYTTMVVRLVFDGTKRLMECTGLYSMTTRKHIGWFLNEYAPDITYSDVRDNYVGEGLKAC